MVCSATGNDGPGVIGVRDGLIAFVDSGSGVGDLPSAEKALNVDDGVFLPGLGDVIGRLDTGAAADFCVVRAGDEPEVMKDGQGETRTGYRWEPIVTVLAGEVV